MSTDVFYSPALTQPNPNGPYAEHLVGAVNVSSGVADAGKVVLLNALGKLDPSMGGGSGPTPSMTFGSNPGLAELGSSVPSVDLSWTLTNIVAVSQVITGTGIVGSVSVSPGTLSYVVNGPFPSPSGGSWTININSGALTAVATLAFVGRRYWGVSASAAPLDDAGVLALAGSPSGGQDFVQSFVREVFYDCSQAGHTPAYPCLAYPSSYGLPNNVEVQGISFSAYTVTVLSLTNGSGYTQDYNVLEFSLAQTGASIKTDWM